MRVYFIYFRLIFNYFFRDLSRNIQKSYELYVYDYNIYKTMYIIFINIIYIYILYILS